MELANTALTAVLLALDPTLLVLLAHQEKYFTTVSAMINAHTS